MPDDARVRQFFFITALRKTAEEHLRNGCCLLFRAFNVEQSDAWMWSFDSETRDRVEVHVRELIGLFERGRFRVKPEHIQDLRVLVAEGDRDFRRFLRVTLAAATRRARKRSDHS